MSYTFGWDSQTYPPALPIVQPLALQTDPVLEAICGYVKGVLNNYVSPAFSEQMQTTQLVSSFFTIAKGAVGDVLPFPVDSNVLQSETLSFPLISVYRESSETIQFTLVEMMMLSNFVINYTLPPLGKASNYNKMYSFLDYSAKTLSKFLQDGNDPNYLNGQQVFREAGASFQYFGKWTYAPITGILDKQNFFFPSMSLTLSVLEPYHNVNSAWGPIGGFDLSVGEIDSSEPTDVFTNVANGYVNF